MTISPYVLAPAAEEDIIEIGAYVAAQNRPAAEKLVAEIYDWLARLAERPALGHRRPDLTSLAVRFWSVRRRYMIVYRGEEAPIQFVRVLSSYRDVASILHGLEQ